MNIKSVLGFALVAVAALGAGGCGDPCGDIKDCCLAIVAGFPKETPKATIDAYKKGCDVYDEAESDACQTAIDNFAAPKGVDLPAECEF